MVISIHVFRRRIHSHSPVSYTHLDVYKRQACTSSANAFAVIAIIGTSLLFSIYFVIVNRFPCILSSSSISGYILQYPFQPFSCFSKYSLRTARLSSRNTPDVTCGFQKEFLNTMPEQLHPALPRICSKSVLLAP